MLKGRGGIALVIILILLLVVVVWLLNRGGGLSLLSAPAGQIPIELRDIIPTGWTLLPQQSQPCSFDDDPDNEWLLLYRYDKTSVKDVYSNKDVGHSVIGGVIYDAQVNRIPQDPGVVSPYRPALLVPYKLLPDYYTGKGQGYLGESDVRFYKYAPGQQDPNRCQAEELYFLGYSHGPLPTRLSIFRWAGRAVGYEGVHFIGDAHVDAPGVVAPTSRVADVTTYNRLQNHRSVLCEVRHFARSGAAGLNFREESDRFTIDFCYGRPADPVYPEAVLIALLRGGAPPKEDSPTGEDFLTRDAQVDPQLKSVLEKKQPLRILAVANQGTIAPKPEAGQRCSPATVVLPDPPPTDARAGRWWCAAEEAHVEASVVLDGVSYNVVARLISIANEQVTTDRKSVV